MSFVLSLVSSPASNLTCSIQRQYWTRKIDLLKASFIEELGKVQDNHKAVHQAYLDEQAKLKELTAKAIEERDLARDDMWWWRGATLGLSLSTTVTIIYLISR
jgi:hypothetical protein